jgi:hypothetical protein
MPLAVLLTILRIYGVVVHLCPETQQDHCKAKQERARLRFVMLQAIKDSEKKSQNQLHTFVGLLNLGQDLDVTCILERCHHKDFYSVLHQILPHIRTTKN